MTTPKRRAALLAYLLQVRDLMRLQAWDIEVSDRTPEDDDAILEVNPATKRHHAPIRVGSFFTETPLEQRQTVVHELVHLIQADLLHFTYDDTWHLALAPDTRRVVQDRVHYELECHADAVARLLAPSMPMPPRWP